MLLLFELELLDVLLLLFDELLLELFELVLLDELDELFELELLEVLELELLDEFELWNASRSAPATALVGWALAIGAAWAAPAASALAAMIVIPYFMTIFLSFVLPGVGQGTCSAAGCCNLCNGVTRQAGGLFPPAVSDRSNDQEIAGADVGDAVECRDVDSGHAADTIGIIEQAAIVAVEQQLRLTEQGRRRCR